MPIIDKAGLEQTKSTLLMQAVFVAGSKVSLAPRASEDGESFYQKAKALFHSGIERNLLTAITATCLLQWWNPTGPEHVSMDNSSFWLRMGVGLAHQIGLHREPNSRLPDASLRRRLWWTLVARDCLIAVSHGRPRAIEARDSDVRPLNLVDFPEQDIDASLFMEFVRICQILGDLTEHCLRGSFGRSDQLQMEGRLMDWISRLPSQLHLHDRQSGALTPYNFRVRQLYLPYFTALTICFRQKTPANQPTAASLLSSSFVAGIFEEFLAWGDVPFLGPTFIFYLQAAAMVQLACHSQQSLWPLAEAELDIINLSLTELAKKYPSAIGAQRVVHCVTGAVKSRQVRTGISTLVPQPEQACFFETFGPEICRKWKAVFEQMKTSDQTNPDVGEQDPQLGQGRYPHEWRALNGDFTEPLAAPILQEHGNAYARPQFLTSPTPAGNNDNHQSTPFGFDHDFAGNLSVGNWMMSDWMTDINSWS